MPALRPEPLAGCGRAAQTLWSRPVEPIRRAVIDVGTNSVKLLVADVAGQDIRPVREESKQTRLGHALYETRRLSPEAIAATAQAVGTFAGAARQCQTALIRVIATSAAREAVNSAELTAAIEQASGLKAEIISGEQEAAMGFQGVTTDARFADVPLFLLDVGGGSSQFTLGQGSHMSFCASFPVGSVRLLEQFSPSDPPKTKELLDCRGWLRQFLQKEVKPRLGNELGAGGERSEIRGQRPANTSQNLVTPDAAGFKGGIQLVGVGGTASILGCMEAKLEDFDRERLEATCLTAARISWHLERLWSLPLAGRKQIIGLPKNRADVILMGTAIYQAVMEEFGLSELHISTRGLRFAALMDSFRPQT